MGKLLGFAYLTLAANETMQQIIDKNTGSAILVSVVGIVVASMFYHMTKVKHPNPDNIVYKDTCEAIHKGTDDKMDKLDTSMDRLHGKVDRILEKQ